MGHINDVFDVRAAAVEALVKVAVRGHANACAALTTCFSDNYGRLGERAVNAFATIAHPEHAAMVLSALREYVCPGVRRAALQQLHNLILTHSIPRMLWADGLHIPINVIDYLAYTPSSRTTVDWMAWLVQDTPEDPNMEALRHAQQVAEMVTLPQCRNM